MILDEIVAKTQIRIEERKKEKSISIVMEEALLKEINFTFPFEKALKNNDIAFICEVKKASPSKGIISNDFKYLDIAIDYEKAGTNAISVLTEPFYFKGKDIFLEKISTEVKIPVLRKDFIIDEYMIYEAKVLGASAVLLICAILDKEKLKNYIDIANSLGISALVEAHDEYEISMALDCGARIIGVNNRDLKNFKVDINNSARLRRLVPKDIIFISESGIKTANDIEKLRKFNVDAVLIGETLMRSENKKQELDELRGYKYE